ncbi:NIPSNAP family protein [Devosia sp. CAU 1758]
MIYEMRVYDCLPGRLPALLRRFNDHTLAIWERHGINQAGFFTTVIGENSNRLTYFLAWESLAAREANWANFIADPAWIKARDDSERDGPILANVSSQLLAPTAFSSVK